MPIRPRQNRADALTRPVRPAGAASADPFGTEALRRSVLEAWASSPARFREDANAEEALATGGYADRLLIELAANALDAAREAGVPGRIRFTLDTSGPVPELRAANVGAPLTAAGVSGLASLRASAKRGRRATVGHFGVGFTAVLAVSDAPEVWSRTGGVRFSRTGTAAAVAALEVDALDAEVTARDGQVPVLRLPWPIETIEGQDDPVPEGFQTQVRLPVRAGLAAGLAALLREVGDDLLWALPGLTTLEVELPGAALRVVERVDGDDGVTVIRHGAGSTSYRAVTGHGIIPVELLADRPIEERDRDQWQLTWVLPEIDPARPTVLGFELDAPADPVFLGAPTPTDEPLSLPARLVGTFPVDDTRRRLAPGPLTAYLLERAAAEYVELFASTPRDHQLALVPSAGFPLGPVDAELRTQIVRLLSAAPVARTVRDESIPPSQACVILGISDAAARLLGRAVPGLLLPPGSTAQAEALRALGVSPCRSRTRSPRWPGSTGRRRSGTTVYQALSDQNSEDLANLPVPLSGGGRRIGPTGCLLPGPGRARRRRCWPASVCWPPTPPGASGRCASAAVQARSAAGERAGPAWLIPPSVSCSTTFGRTWRTRTPIPAICGSWPGWPWTWPATPLPGSSTTWCSPTPTVRPGRRRTAGARSPAGCRVGPGRRPADGRRRMARVIGSTCWPGSASVPASKSSRWTNADADLPDLRDWWDEVVGDGLPPEGFRSDRRSRPDRRREVAGVAWR